MHTTGRSSCERYAGRVTLVGAGPGDPDLLTLAAVRALRDADVVLYDRLAPYQVLAEFAPDAELIDVGKRPGHHALPQERIEALLVERALAGQHVARFKGGDPYVLGRGAEEVFACHLAGVSVRVIPGVTSATAVPSAAGIPLTHRGISHSFTVISGHAPLTDLELESLANLGGTVVVLMGVNTLPHISEGLRRSGLSDSTAVAIVERGFHPDQRTTTGELGDIVLRAGRAKVSSPAVLIIGEVARLAFDGDASAVELIRRAERLTSVPA